MQSEYSHLAQGWLLTQSSTTISQENLCSSRCCSGKGGHRNDTVCRGEVSTVSDKWFTGCGAACDSDRNSKQPVLSVDIWASQSPGQKKPRWRLPVLSCSPEMFWCRLPSSNSILRWHSCHTATRPPPLEFECSIAKKKMTLIS